ncbi:MAG TPA: hypothetical protein VNU94_09545, partial [Acidobacteriaceae bacterium]|nr:hypothetical protein [Acidobacteriaceae bacterium]
LHKSIPIYNRVHLEIAWETFNITNSVRFDAHSVNALSTNGAQFGTYTGTYTNPRQMQFSARLEF